LLGAPTPDAAQTGPWYNLLFLFPMALVDAPLGEEPGWRGFALPRFSPDRTPLANTLILGLLVVGWHLPLALAEPAVTAPYLIAGIASAILTNWIYYNTHGSALLAMLYHTAANTLGIYFSPMLSGADLLRYYWLLAAVNWAAAGIVILAAGTDLQRGPVVSEQVTAIEQPQARL
jgi:membrane protease YdiL (CAAX protease family)